MKFGFAEVNNANVRSIQIFDERGVSRIIKTDLSNVLFLTLGQMNRMLGDHYTLIPDNLDRPISWREMDVLEPEQDSRAGDEKAPGSSFIRREPLPPKAPPLRLTAPAEFDTRDNRVRLEHVARQARSRFEAASSVDPAAERSTRKSLAHTAGAICRALGEYKKREDAVNTNRVHLAGQMLRIARDIRELLEDEDDLLSGTFYILVESLADGEADLPALETVDASLIRRFIRSARASYSNYPDIAESQDPLNTDLIPGELPIAADEAVRRIVDIVESDDGRNVFDKKTLILIDALRRQPPTPHAEADKEKLVKVGAVVGEMWREMSRYATRVQKGVDNMHSWIATFHKVQELWEFFRPLLSAIG